MSWTMNSFADDALIERILSEQPYHFEPYGLGYAVCSIAQQILFLSYRKLPRIFNLETGREDSSILEQMGNCSFLPCCLFEAKLEH